MLRAKDNAQTLEALREGNFPRLSSVAKGVPERLDIALTRAITTAPEARYASASDMRRELDEIVDTRSSRASENDVANFISQLFQAERQSTRERIRTRVLTLKQRMLFSSAVESADVIAAETRQRDVAQQAALTPASGESTKSTPLLLLVAVLSLAVLVLGILAFRGR
jgi:hypothetical protein